MEGRDILAGDFSQPRLTAQLAKEAKVDAVVGSITGILEAAPTLQEFGVTKDVRLIICVSERATQMQLDGLRRLFPNAQLALQYGLTETQGYVGYTCRERLTSDPRALHLAEGTHILELIDPETEEVLPLTPGTEGEVVITTHEPQGFPLIRYKTGDCGIIREGSCRCGSPLLFECLGRLTLDRVRVPRGMLTVAEIENAVARLPLASREFEAKWETEGTLPRLSITLYIDDGDGERVADNLREELEAEIHVAPSVSYRNLREENLVMPLQVLVSKEPAPAGGWKKKKRLL